MKTQLLFGFLSLIISATSAEGSTSSRDNFLKCINANVHHRSVRTIFSHESSLFATLLDSRVQNMRYTNSTMRPILILTPTDEAEIQAAVLCSRKQGLEIRIRSGGHDYEGTSYLSRNPYIIIDLFNLNAVQVDVKDETAWVQTGAQLGDLYYEIAKKSSNLGFPGGVCPTVGIGGHLGGGGFGTLVRKYGLAADNVIDAYIVDYQGIVMNRKAMGEDVFWAIRGGGAASFGIVLSWKVKLVRVPEKVTFFSISKTMNNSFPELNLRAENCTEGSWGESTLHFQGIERGSPIETLLDKTQMYKAKFKAKSDFVKEPIPESGLRGIWELVQEEVVPVILMEPLGGKMSEIPESHTPFPHRKGNLYNVQYMVKWEDGGAEDEKKHLEWMNKLYHYMEPYVTKSPRAAYLNYKDLDIGINSMDVGVITTFSEANVWGEKYFRDNFYRLSMVKSKFDPHNFFRNEQSVPPFRK
ncbi:Berberine bridge enzyme-like 23 [Linum perenne]